MDFKIMQIPGAVWELLHIKKHKEIYILIGVKLF